MDLLNNPVFAIAPLVHIGKTPERAAYRLCDKFSEFLQMPADDQYAQWYYILFSMGLGIGISLLFDLVDCLKHGERASFEMMKRIARMFRFLVKREQALQYVRNKEEDWFSEINHVVERSLRYNLHFAKICSDLSLRCFAHRQGTVQWADANLEHAEVLAELADYDNALDHLQEASDFYHEHGMTEKIADCLTRKALLQGRLGQTEAALELIAVASSYYRQAGKVDDAEFHDLWLPKMILGIRNHEDAMQLINFFGPFFDEADPAWASGWRDFILASFGPQKRTRSIQFLKEWRDDTHAYDPEHIRALNLDVVIAQDSIEQGLFSEARAALDRIDGNSRWNSPKLEWNLAQLRGRLSARLGEIEKASEYYERAIALIEINRAQQSRDDTRRRHLESVSENYDEVTRFFFQQGACAKALEYTEQLKSRLLADRLARNGKRDAGAQPISIDEIMALLPDDETAFVELYPSMEDTIAFVVRRGTPIIDTSVLIDGYGLGNCHEDLKAIKSACSLTELKSSLDELLAHMNEFILSRIRPFLEDMKHVVFFPYSLFHLLPFHAMYSMVNGQRRYLQEDTLVTYAPSAKILRECRGKKGDISGRVVVLNSDPLQDLPFSHYETEAIRGMFQGSIAVPDATKDRFLHHAEACNVLHFAGHATTEALLLQAAEQSAIPEELEFEEIVDKARLSSNRLVTLSACWTGALSAGKTDEALGLPTAFMCAGAPTVVCSLWPVSDLSTTLLMAKMYQAVKQGTRIADSLRHAQLWLKESTKQDQLDSLAELGIATSNRLLDTVRFRRGIRWEKHLSEDLSHPYYWAGFICSGTP